jgi:hypothetical protein
MYISSYIKLVAGWLILCCLLNEETVGIPQPVNATPKWELGKHPAKRLFNPGAGAPAVKNVAAC